MDFFKAGQLLRFGSFGFRLFVLNIFATCFLAVALAVYSGSVALVVLSAIVVFCVFCFVEVDEAWEKIVGGGRK